MAILIPQAVSLTVAIESLANDRKNNRLICLKA